MGAPGPGGPAAAPGGPRAGRRAGRGGVRSSASQPRPASSAGQRPSPSRHPMGLRALRDGTAGRGRILRRARPRRPWGAGGPRESRVPPPGPRTGDSEPGTESVPKRGQTARPDPRTRRGRTRAGPWWRQQRRPAGGRPAPRVGPAESAAAPPVTSPPAGRRAGRRPGPRGRRRRGGEGHRPQLVPLAHHAGTPGPGGERHGLPRQATLLLDAQAGVPERDGDRAGRRAGA
jgi:hypothetical protein